MPRKIVHIFDEDALKLTPRGNHYTECPACGALLMQHSLSFIQGQEVPISPSSREFVLCTDKRGNT